MRSDVLLEAKHHCKVARPKFVAAKHLSADAGGVSACGYLFEEKTPVHSSRAHVSSVGY